MTLTTPCNNWAWFMPGILMGDLRDYFTYHNVDQPGVGYASNTGDMIEVTFSVYPYVDDLRFYYSIEDQKYYNRRQAWVQRVGRAVRRKFLLDEEREECSQ